MADSSGSGISEHGIAHSIICWRRCLRTNDIGGGIFRAGLIFDGVQQCQTIKCLKYSEPG